MHPIHCWGGDRREATVFWFVSAKGRQWIPHHLSVQKSHTYQPIPVFWLRPSCGTQSIGSEDRGSKKCPQATGHQGGFPPTLHSTPPTGSLQRPCTKGPAGRGGVSDPLLGLPQSVHWSVWKDPDTPVVWTPTGTSEWGCGCICFGRAHMVHWPPYEPIIGWSCWFPTLCDHTVSPGELAHPTPPTHAESWKGTLPREYTALLD